MLATAEKLFRTGALCAALVACSAGPLGETLACGCEGEYFAFADIERWEAGAERNNFGDMAELEHYYRAKGWSRRANDLFKRRLQARDPEAIAEQAHFDALKRAAAQDDVAVLRELSGYHAKFGQTEEAERLHLRLIELNDNHTLSDEAFELFIAATNLPDGNPAKLEKLKMAEAYYKRIDEDTSFMDAATLRNSPNIAHLRRRNDDFFVSVRTLIQREITRLEG